jgi:beta-N-acetylhexosaminidase
MHNVERLALGCLFPGFEGLTPPDWLRRWVGDGLGGVVIYGWNVKSAWQLRELTYSLKAERADLLIAIDEEGGDVTRLEVETGSSYPGNAALGAVDDVALTEQVANSTAWDLLDAGANLNFAPVADVNTNPWNPVIGIRSFGSNPELVARHTAAFVRGTQLAGVIACPKHFPGHGDTEVDSHLELPTVESISSDALLPFRAAIGAGARSIMTAHIRVAAHGDAPATMNAAVLQELLREELGFIGMTVTDALEMRAISATVGIEEGAIRALEAGADALCLGHDLDEHATRRVLDAIVEAMRSGRLPRARVEEAVERVLLNREWITFPTRAERVEAEVGLDAARRALRVEGNPVLTKPPLVVGLEPEPSMAAGPMPDPGERLGAVLPDAQVVRLSEGESGGARVPRDRQLVLVLRDAHRHPWQREVADALLPKNRDAVVVEVGVPYWRPQGGGAYIATHGAGRVNVEAAAEHMVGADVGGLYSRSRRGVEQSGSSPGS